MAGRHSARSQPAEPKPRPNRPSPNRALRRLKASWAALLTWLATAASWLGAAARAERQRFSGDAGGFAALGGLLTIVGIIVGSILAAVIGIVVLNALAPLYFNNLKGLIANLTAINLDNGGIGDTMLVVTVLIISIAGPLAFMGLAVATVVMKARGGRKSSS